MSERMGWPETQLIHVVRGPPHMVLPARYIRSAEHGVQRRLGVGSCTVRATCSHRGERRVVAPCARDMHTVCGRARRARVRSCGVACACAPHRVRESPCADFGLVGDLPSEDD